MAVGTHAGQNPLSNQESAKRTLMGSGHPIIVLSGRQPAALLFMLTRAMLIPTLLQRYHCWTAWPPDMGDDNGARPQHPAAAVAFPRLGGGNANVPTSPGDTVRVLAVIHGWVRQWQCILWTFLLHPTSVFTSTLI